MRIERRIAASVAIGGSLLLALSGTVPALASGHSAGLARLNGVGFAATANGKSTIAAGWIFGAKSATSVTAEYKVPTLKCTTATSGVGPIAVMLTGSTSAANFDVAGLILQCSGGSPGLFAAVEVDGTATVGTVSPHAGDLIKDTITNSTTKTTVTVQDLTKGHTFKLTKSGAGAAAFQEQIIDDSLANSTTGAQLPVANFGKISFTKGAVSGKAIGGVKPQVADNMVSKKGVTQIVVGPITGATKNSFLTTWKHS